MTLPLEKCLPSLRPLGGGGSTAHEYWGRGRLHPWCFQKLISWFYSLCLDSGSVVHNTTHVSCHKAHFQLLWAGYEEQALWAAYVQDKVPDNYSWRQPRARETRKQTKTQQTASEWTSFFSSLLQFLAFPPVFVTDCLTETKHPHKKSVLSLKTPGQVLNWFTVT